MQMVLTIATKNLKYENVKVKNRGRYNISSIFPNTIDSRRICDNQNCCKESCREETSKIGAGGSNPEGA